MNEIITNFHFLRPWWLLALAALPLLWIAFGRRGADAGAWRGVVDAHLLQHLLESGSSDAPSRGPRWLVAAGWLLACLALAGPAWERLPQPLYQNRAARVIALELSASMAAQDIKPSRFERARFKVDDILKRSGDAQTALIAYAGDAFVVAPLTDDSNTVANLVDALDPSVMPAAGNDTGRAIDMGVKLIKQAGLDQGEIVLLADSASADASAAASRARAAGVTVSVLGVGSGQGAPVALPQGGFLKNSAGDIVLPKLDVAALAALARVGGGRYASIATDASDLSSVLDTLSPNATAQMQNAQAITPRYLDRGPWLLLLLLPLAALGFRRGWLMLLPLVLCVHSQPAAAFSWVDLWQRPDQQAQAALDAGQAKQAQALARDPSLRGAAAYRAGDFATAAQDFARRADADTDYNRGNALAKQGEYEKAILAYDAALANAPKLADAVANKQAVEDWLKQQQKDKKQQNKQNSKDHQGKQQQQDGSGSSSDQQAQEKKSQDQSGQQDQGQSQKDSAQDSQQESNAAKQGASKPNASGEKQNESGVDKNTPAQAPAHEAGQQAQQQFQKNMDQALKQEGKPEEIKAQTVRLGARDDGKPHDEKQQAVEQWLQRVPDDPGGLLRRKFQLEYQRRQHGDNGQGDD
jgi:Ca-activated chloride channel family protein